MGKIILLFFLLILIMIFPVYENSRIKINYQVKIKNKIPIATIENGNFYIYDFNLSKIGNFKEFIVYKKLFIAKILKIDDLLKKEKYSAKKALLEDKILRAYQFLYKNEKYNLTTQFVIYNLKTKDIYGNTFFLYSDDYNASGKKFFIDTYRNIRADYINFYLKVNK